MSQARITWIGTMIGELSILPFDLMVMKNFSRMVSKCEVTFTSKIIHVTVGWKAEMPEELKTPIHRALDKLGQAQYEPRAPMPVIKDYKDALAKLGEWGRQDV